jgi:hypothetical protein
MRTDAAVVVWHQSMAVAATAAAIPTLFTVHSEPHPVTRTNTISARIMGPW